jgi:hypothetical protein
MPGIAPLKYKSRNSLREEAKSGNPPYVGDQEQGQETPRLSSNKRGNDSNTNRIESTKMGSKINEEVHISDQAFRPTIVREATPSSLESKTDT